MFLRGVRYLCTVRVEEQLFALGRYWLGIAYQFSRSVPRAPRGLPYLH